MGRYIKNFEIDTNAYAARLPIGDNIVAPDHPVDGQLRFNSGNNAVEYYANSRWNKFTRSGVVDVVKDEFYPDGNTSIFIMSKNYSVGRETDILVFIGNVFQNPGVAYTVLDYEITFTSVPNAGQTVVVLHNLNSTETV